MCRGGVCTLMAWGVISWGMNRQGNKVFIICYHGYTEHRSIFHCYLPEQTGALMAPQVPWTPCPVPLKRFCLSPWNYLSTQPVYPSLTISPAQVPTPHLLCPPNPHPCSHSLPQFLHCHDLTDWFGNFHIQLSTVIYLVVTCLAFFLITVEKLETREKF